MQLRVNTFVSSAVSEEINLRQRLRDSENLGGRRLRFKVSDRRPEGRAERLIDGSERV